MVGLAAPQVGISKRFFVIARNLTTRKNSVQSAVRQIDVFINPEIVKGSE
jgi:peptide deformylase